MFGEPWANKIIFFLPAGKDTLMHIVLQHVVHKNMFFKYQVICICELQLNLKIKERTWFHLPAADSCEGEEDEGGIL